MNNVTSRFSLPAAALLVAALLMPSPALADCATTAAEPCSEQSSKNAEAADSAHALGVFKNADGSVSIKIENVEILHVDKTGIRVNGNIGYTGVISDTGSLPRDDGGRDGE